MIRVKVVIRPLYIVKIHPLNLTIIGCMRLWGCVGGGGKGKYSSPTSAKLVIIDGRLQLDYEPKI